MQFNHERECDGDILVFNCYYYHFMYSSDWIEGTLWCEAPKNLVFISTFVYNIKCGMQKKSTKQVNTYTHKHTYVIHMKNNNMIQHNKNIFRLDCISISILMISLNKLYFSWYLTFFLFPLCETLEQRRV